MDPARVPAVLTHLDAAIVAIQNARIELIIGLGGTHRGELAETDQDALDGALGADDNYLAARA
jgi:hypothetical protein